MSRNADGDLIFIIISISLDFRVFYNNGFSKWLTYNFVYNSVSLIRRFLPHYISLGLLIIVEVFREEFSRCSRSGLLFYYTLCLEE